MLAAMLAATLSAMLAHFSICINNAFPEIQKTNLQKIKCSTQTSCID